jgi:hypothetical protein
MIYREKSAVDANWRKLMIEGQEIPVKKTDFEVKRDTEKVLRSGKNRAQARTLGIENVEDSTWEFDYMGGVKFMSVFGVNDINATVTSFAGREFEAIEHVSDPRTGLTAVVGNAGAHTNIVKGCEVIGFKWSFEQGPASATLTVVVSILEAVLFRGAAGGGATLSLV